MKVGEKASFKTVNGESHTGVIVKTWKDKLDRVWYSVKTEQSTCPYPVEAREINESR